METVRDFEDMLRLLARHRVRYLIIGGLAFIYHAKPRFTKDIDLWIDPAVPNIHRANHALVEFGSPLLLDCGATDEIVQIGLPPQPDCSAPACGGCSVPDGLGQTHSWPVWARFGQLD